MAVLVLPGGTTLDELVVDRLLGQGDEVRVLEARADRRDRWSGRGAFLAVGSAEDPDLLERAAQNVRTIVVLSETATEAVVANVLEAGRKAGVDRLVCCAQTIRGEVKDLVRIAPMDHVLIEAGRSGLLRRRSMAPELAALAVDAADDLAGKPRLEIALTDPEQRSRLGL